MPQAIIHVGLPKTGSTSVQKALSHGRRRLEQAGWRVARFTRHGRALTAHTPVFANLFSDRAERFRGNFRAGTDAASEAARYRVELEQNFRSGAPLIFSGEGIPDLDATALARMHEAFAGRGYDLRILAFVRSPGNLLVSRAQHVIQWGAVDPLAALPLAPILSRRVERLRSVFPAAEFYPFAEVVAHPNGPAGFFGDLVEPGLGATLEGERWNPALGAHAAALVLHLNRLLPMYLDAERRQQSPLRRLGDVAPLAGLSGPAFGLQPAELDRAREDIAAENDWLARHLGPEFCDRPGEPAPAAPPVWSDVHARDLPRILRRMPHPLRVAVADYFEARDDVPAALRALPRRHRVGGNWFLRYMRGGPGAATLEKVYRTLRGQR